MRPRTSQSSGVSAARSRQAPWLLTILLIALTFRLCNLGTKSLWLDEVMTVHKATSSFSAMMQEIIRTDAHPPLFQIVEWLWLRLGSGDAFVRLPAVFLGVAVVWLTFLIARRLTGRRSAIAAGLVMALSYFQIFYSQEARLHTLAAALFLAQAYVLLRIVARRDGVGWKAWLPYALLGLLSLYTYALCILTIGALAMLYVLLAWRRRVQWREWFVSHLLIGLAFLPWYWFVLRVTTAKLQENIRAVGDAVGAPSAREVISGIASWGVGPMDWSALPKLGLWLGLALLVAAAVALQGRRSRKPALALGVLFFAPLLGYLLLPMPRVHFYEAKHLIFLQPLLIIALCAARRRERSAVVERAVPSALVPASERAARPAPSRRGPDARHFREARVPPVIYVAAALLALNLFGLRDYYSPSFQKEDWRGLVRDVEGRLQPGDMVMFNPGYVGYAFDYYQTRAVETRNTSAEALLCGEAQEQRYTRLWLVSCQSPVSRPFSAAPRKLLDEGWKPQDGAGFPSEAWPGGLEWTLLTRGAEGTHD